MNRDRRQLGRWPKARPDAEHHCRPAADERRYQAGDFPVFDSTVSEHRKAGTGWLEVLAAGLVGYQLSKGACPRVARAIRI